MRYKIHLFPIALFLLTLVYFVVVRARPFDPGTFNNSFAIAATFIIGICFITGPLSRLKPHFVHLLKYRKPLGLWGFAFAAIHAGAALILNLDTITSAENIISTISAVIAFVIFLAMALTSRVKYIKSMGYEKWKKLQRTGYIAFFFVLLHFTLINNMAFVNRQIGQLLFAFALFVLLLRMLVILLGKREAYKPEEFHEVHEIEPAR
ncbi:MAG TPA: ferric reductase-like transmembrane domain-containing protein [archaeon]|nr:ferric reductase-like transmembrane domain-containing protein [archaeon]